MKAKYLTITLLAIVAIICCLLAGLLGFVPMLAHAEGVTLQGNGDNFKLTERSFDQDDRFVFTATVSFNSGSAAGLVFGADENNKWVFNMDRSANAVKLMYFTSYGVEVIREEMFIGNDKMTDGEKSLVNPKVATLDKVQLKVIISPEEDDVIAEFYADNIRRFGVDNVIKLNELLPDVQYEGGLLGYNCFNANVVFDDIYVGKSDYSYYTELYRQQYHFSQYAHWNNDPNGLVYYNGWYHLYYQAHPFSNYWSDMYWGHARSRDLIHWEHLPICLFPDMDFGGRGGSGYMWSGSAMVYHKGDSAAIDALNWYPDGNGSGLIAFYTRDGAMQDQVIMSSDDGGMTWTKRKLIPQTIATAPDGYNGKTDCRDPKVFPVKKDASGKTTLWGMVLTGMATYDVWFLQSSDLLNWSYAGEFKADGIKTECPDVVTLQADDGKTYNVLALTGRNYIVGTVTYDDATQRIKFLDLNGNDLSTLNKLPTQKMDYGPDSYATQTYFIDDESSQFYGKTVSLSWFSGIPGDAASIESGLLADARKVWNGGGMTIPVEWGLKQSGNGYLLTQTPIVKDFAGFAELKTQAYTSTGVEVNAESKNILGEVKGHNLEILAEITNPNDAWVAFRINMNGNEYTEIGWNKQDGYYVDRTYTSNAGMSMNNYHVRYTSGACGIGKQTFYILSDNGGVEVFCEDFTIPFYVLTFSSPYAQNACFVTDGAVTLQQITVNNIANIWRTETVEEDETVLYVDEQEVELDMTLTTCKEVMVYATSGGELSWNIQSGQNVVSLQPTEQGAKITALSAGNAVITVACGNVTKTITVMVYSGTCDSDVTFNTDGIVAGSWHVTTEGILGIQSAGDGFILSNANGKDFTYSANFSLSGAAAAIVFRAKADMSDYLIANYDNNGKIVKLWSPRGEIGRASVNGVDLSNITLKVKAAGTSVIVYLNGNEVINVTLNETEPTEGLFGLNTCAGRAIFKSVVILKENYQYSGGKLIVKGDTNQAVTALYNVTAGNVKINRAFYTYSGRTLEIAEEYFATLKTVGTYTFTAVGANSTYTFSVEITQLPTIVLQDITIEVGCNAVIYVGNITVHSVVLNGVQLTNGYSLQNGMLTISSDQLTLGENILQLQGGASVKITVIPQQSANVKPDGTNLALIISLSVVGGVLVLGGVAALTTVLLIRRKKKNGGDN